MSFHEASDWGNKADCILPALVEPPHIDRRAGSSSFCSSAACFRPDVPLIPDVSLTCGGRRVCIRRSWYTYFVGRHTRVRRPPKDGGMFERRGRQGENDSLPMIIMQVVRDRYTG